MKLFNTLTGETFLVSRMANQYQYELRQIGTKTKFRMNHE